MYKISAKGCKTIKTIFNQSINVRLTNRVSGKKDISEEQKMRD